MARYYSDMVNQPTCVYRLYDADERLLYVGLTMNPQRRMEKHRRTSWWPKVATTREAWFENRRDAKAAEAVAVRDEKPLHNIARPTGGA